MKPSTLLGLDSSARLPRKRVCGIIYKYPNRWTVDFDYFYTGEPQGAVFHIDLTLESGTGTIESHGPKLVVLPKPGAHHLSTSYQFSSEGTSRQSIVTLTTAAWPDAQVLASARIDKVIKWPTLEERNFDLAQDLIGAREWNRKRCSPESGTHLSAGRPHGSLPAGEQRQHDVRR